MRSTLDRFPIVQRRRGAPADGMPRSWPWYVARARAMSTHELVWRAVTTAALPLRTARRRTLTPPTWGRPEWEAAVRALAAARAELLLPAAERIARGELEF